MGIHTVIINILIVVIMIMKRDSRPHSSYDMLISFLKNFFCHCELHLLCRAAAADCRCSRVLNKCENGVLQTSVSSFTLVKQVAVSRKVDVSLGRKKKKTRQRERERETEMAD